MSLSFLVGLSIGTIALGFYLPSNPGLFFCFLGGAMLGEVIHLLQKRS